MEYAMETSSRKKLFMSVQAKADFVLGRLPRFTESISSPEIHAWIYLNMKL